MLPLQPPPPPAGSSRCTPSNLGYDCSTKMEDGMVTVHWSTSDRAPINDCTSAAGGEIANNPASFKPGMLHMAIQGRSSGEVLYTFDQFYCGDKTDNDTTILPLDALGYVGLGFAASNTMFNSDVVMGWIDSSQKAMVRCAHREQS